MSKPSYEVKKTVHALRMARIKWPRLWTNTAERYLLLLVKSKEFKEK